MNDMGKIQLLGDIGSSAVGLAGVMPQQEVKAAADRQNTTLLAATEHNGMGSAFNEAKTTFKPEDEAAATEISATSVQELGEEFGKIKYLQNEHNLALPPLTLGSMDENLPFDSFSMAGKWLKEAANLENYWLGVQKFGEEFAAYKWARDEGKLDEFNVKEFIKEAGKAGLRSVGSDVLRTSGNLLTMFGANMAGGSAATTVLTSGAGMIFPEAGKEIAKIGQALRGYAEQVENLSFLAPDEQVLAAEPSWNKLANALGSGSSQVLAMGTIAKFMGSGAAYGFFAGGGAGEMFNEAYEQSGDLKQANTLAAANAGVTFAIDKLFNPLPEMVEKNAKATSKMIAKEIFGAPLREVGSEVLQQMLAENLVRKVGLDDTQDLFEGMIESALGAIAGSSVLTTASSVPYYADKSYELVRKKILLHGVSQEEFKLYEKNMQQLMESKPEAFNKILQYNLKENLRAMDREARKIKKRQERESKRKNIKGFQDVFDTMHKRFADVLGEGAKAKAAASVFEAGAMSLYERDNSLTPQVLLDGMLPKLQKIDVNTFLQQELSLDNVSFQIIGANAQNAKLDKMSQAMNMERTGADAQKIWADTNWNRGEDGVMRSEISSANARIKLWDDDMAEKRAVAYLREERNKLNDLRSYLAAGLDTSSNGVFGSYYQDFLKYLDKTEKNTSWYDDVDALENKTFAFDIVDPFEAIDRESENLRLGMLLKSQQHAQKDSETAPFWQKLQDDYLYDTQEKVQEEARDGGYMMSAARAGQDYGTVSVGLNGGDNQLIWSMIERRRFESFRKRFWDPLKGPNAQFLALAEEKDAEYRNRKDYNDLMERITQEANERRRERAESIREKGITQNTKLFQDIDLEEAYRKYVAYTGDFSGELSDWNHFGEEKNDLHTSSERFLAQGQYSFLNDIDKRVLLDHLDRVELLYRIDKHLNHLNDFETNNAVTRNRYAAEKLANGEYAPEKAARWQARLSLKNGMEMPLGDLLEYPELYNNYPVIEKTSVRFTKLKDGEAYHFYHDRDKGYVFEIDADKLYYANMKETLFLGTQFIINDIEGFDYALTDKQRKNFMDRHFYAAKKEVENDVIDELRKYVALALPGVNPNQFIVKRDMPVALAGLAESKAADGKDAAAMSIKYREIDYDKLTDAVLKKHSFVASPEGIYVRKYMYANLQRLKSMDLMKVMTVARQRGGYGAAGLPWSGLTSQGTMDARAVLRRMDMTPEELRMEPYFDDNTDLRAFNADIMDASSEFERRVKEDRQNYKQTLEKLARGAYNSADNIISLFEKSDTSTIVHETFHSFWNMMEQAENRSESHGANFHLVMDDLRESLLQDNDVVYRNNAYYIVDKKSGEKLQELPLGYRTSKAAVDAGVQEIFVLRLMSMFNGKNKLSNSETLAEAADFYRRWLSTLTLKLNITEESSGNGGKKLLELLKKKFSK